MPSVAARIYASLTGLVIASNLDWRPDYRGGVAAMGGRYSGKFPNHLRGAAIVQALLLAVFATIVVTRAGLLFPQWLTRSQMPI